jgi:hypothetical protein
MKHVRVSVTADGREAELHPMYDVMANAPFVDYATAMQWNVSEDELGILHYVEGNVEAYREVLEETPEVIEFHLTEADGGSFYAFVYDELTPAVRAMFDTLDRGSMLVVPPIEYPGDGTVTLRLFGRSAAIQAALDGVPDPVDVTVEEITGKMVTPRAVETLLADRQREAVETAHALGYYDVPRSASHEDVAEAINCAPSTANEHLRKAESTLLGAMLSK